MIVFNWTCVLHISKGDTGVLYRADTGGRYCSWM